MNVKAYGKVTEECIGHQRTIRGTKVVISADDLLVIKGQNVRIQAQGEIQLAGSAMTKVSFAAPLITDNRHFGLRMNTLTKSFYGGNVSAQINAPIVKVGGEKTPGIVKVNDTD